LGSAKPGSGDVSTAKLARSVGLPILQAENTKLARLVFRDGEAPESNN